MWNGTADGDIITMDCLHYDVNTIKEATQSFSEDNKLGQGGFGDVYKVTCLL